MKTTLKLTLAALLTVASCWASAQQVSAIRGSDVPAADQAPEVQPYVGSKPGAQTLIKRTFQQQPPLVPHKVEGFDDINSEENPCMDCHMHDVVRGQKVPKVKDSHLVKTANAGDEPALDRRRWQCNSCHVPQIDAKPLVENIFKASR